MLHKERVFINLSSYSGPYRFKAILSIAVVGINTVVCKPQASCCDSNSFDGTVLKAPKTIGTIIIFALHYLLTLAAKSMYLSIFFSSFSLT